MHYPDEFDTTGHGRCPKKRLPGGYFGGKTP
jgi:hypothetical protein